MARLTPPVLDLSATELSQRIHAREISCRELMVATMAQIDALNPVFNAIVSRVDTQLLLAQAEQYDREIDVGHSRGWMHGFPMAIKDMCATAGVRTTKGSPLLADNLPTVDDLMVQRMKAAGGILIGKSNTPEFGLGSHTYNPVFGDRQHAQCQRNRCTAT